MKAKNIQPLPNEESQWFESSNIYLGETNFIGISAESDKNIKFTANKHQKSEHDNHSFKSELANVSLKDEIFDDAQWLPECEPREIIELEAIQLTEAKITSQGYPSAGRVTESIITPSFAELIKEENISDKTIFSNAQSESAPQKIIQFITELRIVDRDEASEKPKLSGIWGEKFAVEYLRRKFGAKYPKGKLDENQYGFSIKINSQVVVEVEWLNEVQ